MVIVLKSRAMIITALITAMLSCLCLGMNVSAEKKVTLTVECKQYDTPLEGMPWDIYRIADFNDEGEFVLTESFKNYKVNINDLSTSEAMAAAETLNTYAETDYILPLASDIVGADGIVEFSGLTYGLYLLSGTDTVINGTSFNPAPSLITIDEGVGDDGIAYFNYNVWAKPKIKTLPDKDRVYKFNATVKLFWEKDDPATRPESVNVILTKDGEAYKSAVLSAANNWTVTWENLNSNYKWNVIEEIVPDGYTVTYVQNEINVNPDDPKEHDVEFIITNTGNYVPAETTKASKPLPQTGQLWWPVPALSAAGMVVFAVGWVLNICKRKHNEK